MNTYILPNCEKKQQTAQFGAYKLAFKACSACSAVILPYLELFTRAFTRVHSSNTLPISEKDLFRTKYGHHSLYFQPTLSKLKLFRTLRVLDCVLTSKQHLDIRQISGGDQRAHYIDKSLAYFGPGKDF